MKKQQLDSGSISKSKSLASKEKGLIKKALLCRTGTFSGMYGEVTVTKEMLEGIMERYISDKANPTNQHDYAPILLNHDRNVELVQGRLLADGMSVEKWKEIDGKMTFGLFGNLRIDEEDAIKKVETGKYAQLSISFDEETYEFFEVSFVAVEAARGSIVLEHKKQNPKGGSKMAKNKNIATLSKKHTALMGVISDGRKKRKAALSKMISQIEKLEGELVTLEKKSNEIALSIKAGHIKGKLNALVRQDKVNPVELKAMDFKTLAAMPEVAITAVLAAYETRKPMGDAQTYGQKADKKINLDMSPEAMREAIKLQKSGKGIKLSQEEEDEAKKKLAEGSEDDKEKVEDKDHDSMSAEDLKACLEEMEGHHAKLAECISKFKEMSGAIKDMSEGEDKEEEEIKKKEEEHKLSEEDSEDEGEE